MNYKERLKKRIGSKCRADLDAGFDHVVLGFDEQQYDSILENVTSEYVTLRAIKDNMFHIYPLGNTSLRLYGWNKNL